MKQTVILLAGIPAAGKSHFGRWLENRHDFLHFDVEKDGRLRALGLEPAWMNCFQADDVSPFIDALRHLGRPILLNWGFPVNWLPLVERLKQNGVVLWWFEADAEHAISEFIRRGDVSLAAFERQMKALADSHEVIEAVFRPNIITTLDDEGRRMEPEEIYRRVFLDRDPSPTAAATAGAPAALSISPRFPLT